MCKKRQEFSDWNAQNQNSISLTNGNRFDYISIFVNPFGEYQKPFMMKSVRRKNSVIITSWRNHLMTFEVIYLSL